MPLAGPVSPHIHGSSSGTQGHDTTIPVPHTRGYAARQAPAGRRHLNAPQPQPVILETGICHGKLEALIDRCGRHRVFRTQAAGHVVGNS